MAKRRSGKKAAADKIIFVYLYISLSSLSVAKTKNCATLKVNEKSSDATDDAIPERGVYYIATSTLDFHSLQNPPTSNEPADIYW